MDIFAASFGELAALASVLLAAGVAAGLLAGLLGVGGGIVIVPVLFHLFGILGIDEAVRMHIAVGTSLATIIPTSIRSMRSHHKKGAVDLPLLKQWALPIALGVVAGSITANFVTGRELTLIFATIALLVAVHMAFGREDWRLGHEVPRGGLRLTLGGMIGFFSTLMGIGGGSFGVPLMTLFGVPIHRAVGTASGIGLIISVPGTIGFMAAGFDAAGTPPFSIGYVSLIGFALIVPATVLAAPWGARLAHAISRLALRRAFALFLAITSVRMFWSVFG